jgi:hypothetical protein
MDREDKDLIERDPFCAICGKDLENEEQKIHVGHLINKSVYKWTKRLLNFQGERKLLECIESPDNIILTHEECNTDKIDIIPSIQYIESLKITEDREEQFENLYNDCCGFIAMYIEIKKSVRHHQNNKCACCGRKINMDNCSLKRVDKKFDRVTENAVAVFSE